MKELRDKHVIVTGASRGLGVDIAKRFATEGTRLSLGARTIADLDRVADEIRAAGGIAHTYAVDVSDLASLGEFVANSRADSGPADVLINNAGVEAVTDFETMEPSEIAWIINVNVIGLLTLSRLIVPSMIERKSGHIVNISSMAGLLPVPHNSVYSTSKHAVVGASRSLRLELAEYGIGVSVVCPGFVEGGMFALWGRKPPSAAGSVTTADVADAVLRAVKLNKPLIKVNKVLGRSGPLIDAISPRYYDRVMRVTGVARFLRDQAKINADRE